MVTLREFAGGALGATAGAVAGHYFLQGFGDFMYGFSGNSPYQHMKDVAELGRYAFQYGAPMLLGSFVGYSLFKGRIHEQPAQQNANQLQPQAPNQNPPAQNPINLGVTINVQNIGQLQLPPQNPSAQNNP